MFNKINTINTIKQLTNKYNRSIYKGRGKTLFYLMC